ERGHLHHLRHAEGRRGGGRRGTLGAAARHGRSHSGRGVESALRINEGARLSLTGNLEDLPLLDILQIVSFSKKTGYLSIRTGAGEGAIVFHDGFVTSS